MWILIFLLFYGFCSCLRKSRFEVSEPFLLRKKTPVWESAVQYVTFHYITHDIAPRGFVRRLHVISRVPSSHVLAFYCIHCNALHCIALHCNGFHSIATHCTALHCIASHCTALRCIALHCSTVRYGTVRYGTVRYSTVQYDLEIADLSG